MPFFAYNKWIDDPDCIGLVFWGLAVLAIVTCVICWLVTMVKRRREDMAVSRKIKRQIEESFEKIRRRKRGAMAGERGSGKEAVSSEFKMRIGDHWMLPSGMQSIDVDQNYPRSSQHFDLIKFEMPPADYEEVRLFYRRYCKHEIEQAKKKGEPIEDVIKRLEQCCSAICKYGPPAPKGYYKLFYRATQQIFKEMRNEGKNC